MAEQHIYEPGQKLRCIRENLNLRYRDVEEASLRIANQRSNPEFVIGLSRLADIENKGTVPSVYRLYSLCAIYKLEFNTVLKWYGLDLGELPKDSTRIPITCTHAASFSFTQGVSVDFPVEIDSDIDLHKTTYLDRHIEQWGTLPLAVLTALDLKRYRYGFVGTEDWSMHPLLPPGSFIQVDETKRRIAREGWTHESERPIYFVEHRKGFRCGWCSERNGKLTLQTHPASLAQPEIFRYPQEIEVIGQIIGVAMRLDLGRRRHTRSSAIQG